MPFRLDSDGILRLRAWKRISWLVHGFTTRVAGDFRTLRLKGATSAVGAGGMSLALVRQVHSSRLHVLSSASPVEAPRSRPEADGLLTAQAGSLLGVRTADCLPLLFVDGRSRAVAAVHAGWRGTLKQIARRAVEQMQREFGSRLADLEVAIGPGIGPCCYEVGPEVAAQFHPSAVIASKRPRIDLEFANRRQLWEAGVPEERIWAAQLCTRCLPEQFFSYRRDGNRTGRMLALVGIRSASRQP